MGNIKRRVNKDKKAISRRDFLVATGTIIGSAVLLKSAACSFGVKNESAFPSFTATEPTVISDNVIKGTITEPIIQSIGERSTIKLPEITHNSGVSLEQSLLQRRSIREYNGQPLILQELSQLLWAAQGITNPNGFRTAPSAGGLYPLEVYIFVGDVKELTPGVYRYKPVEHKIIKIIDGDRRTILAKAALDQIWVHEGSVSFVFTGVYDRTTVKYGDRGIRYVHMEVGHAAQNLCLQATTMGLGVVTIGAFLDEQVINILRLPKNEQPLYIIPSGRR